MPRAPARSRKATTSRSASAAVKRRKPAGAAGRRSAPRSARRSAQGAGKPPALPRIVVNAKVYAEATGAAGAARLAKACAAVAKATGAGIALAPPLAELATLSRSRGTARTSSSSPMGLVGLVGLVGLYGQHCDARVPGASTGWVTAEALAAAGAVGSIVNHAEHKLPHDQVAAVVGRLREAGLAQLVCADSLAEARALAALRPTMLAIEPPELIGGDVSVTTADPRIVSDAVAAVRAISPDTAVLCGAGVKTGADVAAALRLGAHGVLLASGVVKAKDPTAALRDLAAGLGASR